MTIRVVRPPVDGGTALVTGASAGIGRELAIQLAPRVSTLILVARRVDRLTQVQTELMARHPQLKVLTVATDLSDEDEVAGVLARVREIGSVDILVNAAGLGASGLFDRTDWSRTRQVLRTNVVALAQLSAALIPEMVANGRGGVLNIGSGAGLTVMPAAAAYTGSKHFVDGFSEALRADLAGTGVVVTQVCPGPVDSEFDEVAGSLAGNDRKPTAFYADQRRAMRAGGPGRLRPRRCAGLPRPVLPTANVPAVPALAAPIAALAVGPVRCGATGGARRTGRRQD
jgi:short-subunit dehydrogenase